MVFESVVADILNIYLGDYVENLDRSQLQIGIWGGDVVLQDLVLKPDVLDELDLPLKCTFGHLGRLVLKIPWKNLYKAPVIATIERLFLLAVPDPVYHQKNSSQKAKQATLQRLEVARSLKKEADKSKTPDTFVEKLATQIIKNIQIKIQDIHIRYEDASTNPKCPFALGVTLHKLSVQSTDKNWREGLVQDASSMIYKVLNLEGLAVYWNCQSSLFSLYESREDMLNLFREAIFCYGEHPERFCYILGPITSAARLQLNPKPECDEYPFRDPKIVLTVLMETLAIGISKEQYHSLVELLNFFDFSNKISEYQKHKPLVPKQIGFYRQWWIFAKNCVLSQRWRGIEWEQMKRHCQLCRDYASVYMQKIQAGANVPNDIEKEISRCECDLDTFNIIRIRRQVEAEVEWLNQKSPKESQSSGLSSWIGSWWWGTSTAENSQLTDKFKHELTAEEKLKLYQAIDYEENSDPAHYPEDFVERKLVFQLKNLVVNIQDSGTRVLLAKLSGVSSSLEQRPSAGAFRMTLKMSELGAWGKSIGDTSPPLVKSLTDGSESVLMKFFLETNPLDKACGRRLHIHAAPLKLIYDACTIMSLASIFQGPQSGILVQLQAAAGAQLSEMSALGLQYAIEHHVITEVEIDLKSSYVLIPYEGYYAGYNDLRDLLVINLGQLSVMTLPRDQASNPRKLHEKGFSKDRIVATMREESYDRFRVKLNNVQVLFALAGENWEDALHSEKPGRMHLVKPVTFSCDLEKCLVQNDPSLPNLKILGELTTVSIIAEDYRIIHLMKLYESIPALEAHEHSEMVNIETYVNNPVSDILESSDTVSIASSEMSLDCVKLDLQFTMQGVTATLFKTTNLGANYLKDSKSEKMLELSVLHLGFSILQRSNDMTISARLGGVTLIYTGDERNLMLLDPTNQDPQSTDISDMLTIKYTNVARIEDNIVDEPVQFLEADFSHLTVLLHHEILLSLLDYGQTFLKCLESASSISQFPQSNSQQKANKSVSRPQKIVKKTDSDFRISARLHAFNVSLLQQQQPLAHFMVEGMEADTLMSKSSTEISARLRNVCLLDPNPMSSHNKIVSILGREALSLKVVMFQKSRKENKSAANMSIQAHLSRSRIVFLNSFTQAIMGFLNSFQTAQENIAQVVADAAEAAKKKVLHAHAESQFVVLDMIFQAPLIIVPVSTTSLEVLHLDFGQLLVKNKLKKTDAGPVDVIQLDLEHLQVARVKLTHASEVVSEEKLVLPMTFCLQLARSLVPPTDGTVPAVTMHGHLDNLEVSLNRSDVQMIMRILAENLDSETPRTQPSTVSRVNGTKIESESSGRAFIWELHLSMSTLKLHLGLNQFHQLNFAMTGSDFAIIKKKHMQVSFHIKDLIATNPFAISTYQKVVAVEGTEALSVEVVMYDRSTTDSDNDMVVKASMARIRVIYLPSMISALKEFLQGFNYEPEGIVEAMAGVAGAARDEVIQVHQQATRIGLNIDLKAPVIILPHQGMDRDVLLLDFGNLTIKNDFQITCDPDTLEEVVIDNMMLGLQDLKISRVELGTSSEVVNECLLLQPINLFIEMKRNLSNQKSSTVPDLDLKGHLKSVVVGLNQNDVQLVMLVLNNFTGSSEQETGNAIPSASSGSSNSNSTQVMTTSVSILFSFTMEKLVMELFDEAPNALIFIDNAAHNFENSLARWSLVLLEIQGTITDDGSLTTNLFLTDCQLDDSRQGRLTGLTRLLERKLDHNLHNARMPESRNMEILYYKKGQHTDVKIQVFSFNLVLSLEYLRHLSNFLAKAFEQSEQGGLKQEKLKQNALEQDASEQDTLKVPRIQTAMSQQLSTLVSPAAMNQQSETTFFLSVHAENPDVFLVEDMEDPKTTSLVLKSDIKCTLKQMPSITEIYGMVEGLQVYSCCYHPDLRMNTMSQILQPCSMVIEGTSSHFEVQVSNIRLRVSPGALNLLSRVMTAVYTREENAGDIQNTEINYRDIWTPKSLVDSDHWFLKTEIGEDALQMPCRGVEEPKSVLHRTKEICILKMPSLTITVEAGAGSHTLPMIMLTAGINAMALDWSSKLTIDSSVSLQMAYYNSLLALWEPLIEPVELNNSGLASYRPWELTAKIEMDYSTENDSDKPSMSIHISSQDSLELTLTKTCLEVLSGVGQAFQIVGDEVQREGPPAPYHIINHTGISLALLLDGNPFKEYNQNTGGPAKRSMEPGESVPLNVEDQINLQSLNNLLAQRQAEEKYLRVLVEDLNEILVLPVVQAGQRHFPLKQGWILISDICVESGSMVVTLRSCVQIFNNLGLPIDIHYKPEIHSDLKFVNTIPSGEHLDVPFDALYNPSRELYISVPGYDKKTYAWAEDFSLNSSVLRVCESTVQTNKESVFLKILREKHRAYSESTNTLGTNSIFYKIFVQPPIKLKNLLPVGITVSQPEISIIHALSPGERLNIATARPDTSKLLIQIPDYRQEEWFCEFQLKDCDKEFPILIFHCGSRSLTIGAHRVYKRGIFILTLYSPYWILNKTGLPLSYKLSDGSTVVSHHPNDARAAVIFPSFSGNMKAAIQVADGNWSQCFSLDTPGSAGIAICPALGQVYRLGVCVQLMRCTLTKQVTITPHFVLINSCQHALECQEATRPADLWVKVEAGECCAIWPVNPDNCVMLRARFSSTTQITAPFPCSVAHTTLLRLDNQWGGINVDVQLTESSVYITFTNYEPGQAAALFVNHSDVVIPFSQKGSNIITLLNPGTELLFTWMEPIGSREIDFMLNSKQSIEEEVCQLRRDASGRLDLEPDMCVFWSSFLDGAQRVLLFSGDPSIAQSGQEAGKERIQKSLSIDLSGVGLSIVDNIEKVEVIYIAVSRMPEKLRQRYNTASRSKMKNTVGLWMQVSWFPHEVQVHVKLDHLQADCQLPDCTYPVALAPVPPPRSVAASNVARPFIEFSAVVRKAIQSSLQQVQYCKTLVQAFQVKVDMGLISALAALVEAGEPSDEVEVAQFLEDFLLVKALLPAHVALGAARGQKHYFYFFHFSPLKIHLSLSLSGDAEVRKGREPPHALRVLLHSLGVTLTNVQDVVFRLAYFERHDVLLSTQQLLSQASEHYRSQVLKQLYVLVLGLDVLGNPLNFVKGLRQGVEDMFYEPIQGAIQGPEEFAQGLALGVRSLFSHTVGGAFGAASRITGAMGSGVAALTFDDEYQRRRQEAISNRPTSVTKGLAQSGEGLVKGVVDGVSGVFLKPISGAKKGGVEGFFKGFGKGVAGLIARPTAGVIDFASGSFDALRRTTDTTVNVEKLRPPRFFRPDGRVRPYVFTEAEGNKILQDLVAKNLTTPEIYDCHIRIGSSGQTIFMLTNKRAMLISHSEILETWKVEWQMAWTALDTPHILEDGIFLPERGKHTKKSISKQPRGHKVIIKDPETIQWVAEKINILMKS